MKTGPFEDRSHARRELPDDSFGWIHQDYARRLDRAAKPG